MEIQLEERSKGTESNLLGMHYSVTLGAVLLKNQRMFILKEQAEFLIKKYFYNEEK
jgi:hypothetical protein